MRKAFFIIIALVVVFNFTTKQKYVIDYIDGLKYELKLLAEDIKRLKDGMENLKSYEEQLRELTKER